MLRNIWENTQLYIYDSHKRLPQADYARKEENRWSLCPCKRIIPTPSLGCPGHHLPVLQQVPDCGAPPSASRSSAVPGALDSAEGLGRHLKSQADKSGWVWLHCHSMLWIYTDFCVRDQLEMMWEYNLYLQTMNSVDNDWSKLETKVTFRKLTLCISVVGGIYASGWCVVCVFI